MRINKEKLQELFEIVNLVAFDTSIDWHKKFNYDYYLFFNDQDAEKKVGSIFAFLGMLINWFYKSSFAFRPDTGKTFLDCPNNIENYLIAFQKNSNSIKNELPVTHSSICYLLNELDKKMNFESEFPHVDKRIFENMRSLLRSEGTEEKLNFDRSFEEIKEKLNI